MSSKTSLLAPNVAGGSKSDSRFKSNPSLAPFSSFSGCHQAFIQREIHRSFSGLLCNHLHGASLVIGMRIKPMRVHGFASHGLGFPQNEHPLLANNWVNFIFHQRAKSKHMPKTAETIDHSTLEHLAGAGAIRGASVIGQPGGWGVVFQCGTTERALVAKRGQVRIFKKFDTLAVYLKQIGIDHFKTDTKQFDPTVTHVKRTDTSERMRKAHEAAAHDAWFRAQVEQGLKEADDPENQWVSNETVMAESAKRRDIWRSRAKVVA